MPGEASLWVCFSRFGLLYSGPSDGKGGLSAGESRRLKVSGELTGLGPSCPVISMISGEENEAGEVGDFVRSVDTNLNDGFDADLPLVCLKFIKLANMASNQRE